MASQLTNLSVFPRGKPIKGLPEELALPKGAPTSEIYQQLASISKSSIHRLRVTKASDNQAVPNSKDTPIAQTGLLGGSKIYVKDMGPQAAWRTVYVIEYLGPPLIHALFFQLRPYIYSKPDPSAPFPPPSPLQSLSLFLFALHFLKREFETVFVHHFTAPTMPFFYIYRNAAYYWGLAGLVIAYPLYSPTALAAGDIKPWLLYPGLALFVAGEVLNAHTHLVLRGLRSGDGQPRANPRGGAFDWVTSPNYMYETVAWIGLCLITASWGTVVFTTAAVYMMARWAGQRERRYRKTFGDEYKKKRYLLLPGIY